MQDVNTVLTTSDKIPLLRYDWVTLRNICKGDRSMAARVLTSIFVDGAPTSKPVLVLAEKYMRTKVGRGNNFLVGGSDVLKRCHLLGVKKYQVGEYIELASYRDIENLMKNRDSKIDQRLVLDIIETIPKWRDNPLFLEKGDYIVFTCEQAL